MGFRLLRRTVLQPPTDVALIEARYDAVDCTLTMARFSDFF